MGPQSTNIDKQEFHDALDAILDAALSGDPQRAGTGRKLREKFEKKYFAIRSARQSVREARGKRDRDRRDLWGKDSPGAKEDERLRALIHAGPTKIAREILEGLEPPLTMDADLGEVVEIAYATWRNGK